MPALAQADRADREAQMATARAKEQEAARLLAAVPEPNRPALRAAALETIRLNFARNARSEDLTTHRPGGAQPSNSSGRAGRPQRCQTRPKPTQNQDTATTERVEGR